MPTYVYKNLATGETFELQQRITESALTTHPETGDPIKRLIQPVGIAFKGSGFYVNDSRTSTSKASTSKDADTKSDAKGAADTKADTKSEKKDTKESKGTSKQD